jgi:hypothetical protein
MRYIFAGLTLAVCAAAGPVGSARLLSAVPQGFEPNRGQIDRNIDFVSHGLGYSLLLAPGEAQVRLTTTPKNHRWHKSADVRVKFLGANTRAHGQELEPQTAKSNYFIGNDPAQWRKDMPRYSRVEYHDVYPGVDIAYYGAGPQLEYDLLLRPHADPSKIRLKITGADRIRIDEAGNLLLSVGQADIRELKPVIYQSFEAGRQRIDGRYVLMSGHTVGFAVADYDRAKPLVIDPVLEFSSFFGGTGNDNASTITLDSSGNSYVAGFTSSSTLAGTRIGTPFSCGGVAAFIAKINSSGNLVFATYLGGTNDQSGAIGTVDGNGNIYITGATHSSNFPTVHPLYGTYNGGVSDTYVAELNSAGNALIFSTFFGGNGQDYTSGIGLDSAGNVYIVGTTTSTNLPTQNPVQAHPGNMTDAFAAKFAAGGTALLYSTYLAGNNYDFSNGMTVDSNGTAYLYGDTESTDYPVQNALQPSFCGWTSGQPMPTVGHGWVTVLGANGSLIYSTYICGDAASDSTRGAALDRNGNLIITGQTESTVFRTLNPLQAHHGGGANDAFIMSLSPSGSLLYSSYLGGSGDDIGRGVAVDSAGNWYITGQTSSSIDFPTTADRTQPAYGGGTYDTFVTKISAAGTPSIVFSTFLGGSADEVGHGIAVDSLAQAYIVGSTGSNNFPTRSPFQATYGGGAGPHDATWSVIATCDFTFSTQSPFLAGGGSGNISVTTTPECAWNATSNASWITSVAPASGAGPGSVSYSVSSSNGSARSGTITIAGQTITVNQLAGPVISSVSPSSGGKGAINLALAIVGNQTHFAAGVSAVSFSGTGIAPGTISVTDATHMTANINIAANAPVGPQNVTVTTGTEVAVLTVGFTVASALPPGIGAEFGATSLGLGGTTSLSFSVSNPNPGTSLTNVGFTDTLPSGLVVATPNGLSGNCGGGTIAAIAGTGAVSLSGATLGAGAECVFSVNVTAASGGPWVNTTGNVSSTQATGGTAAANLGLGASGSSSYSFVTGATLSQSSLRNNFAGYVGLEFTLGSTALSVSAVGRMCVAGNTGTHTVKLVNVATGLDVAGSAVGVSMSGCTPGQYQYAVLAGAVTLVPGTAYYLVSSESGGGDQWYDMSAVAASAGVVNAAAWFDGTTWRSLSGAASFVPPNFLYL